MYAASRVHARGQEALTFSNPACPDGYVAILIPPVQTAMWLTTVPIFMVLAAP